MNLNIPDKAHVTREKSALGDVCSHGKIKNIVNGDFLCFRNTVVCKIIDSHHIEELFDFTCDH